ncbi:hypothetical protein OZX72_08715 [Bifidobacterium sp. ESL0769]|uniref:hypothetical protein n=1 Tax=Bifidobacterium sp. ESL0769 TaxID=2983229 RepID=UPI0023F846B7|nr:hypothetical protein [Bifidobacterium sp. ESL0769]WEV67298.1 hypothetical protein OZX72_08715 [Bifidobacterium sp. ESL0769]
MTDEEIEYAIRHNWNSELMQGNGTTPTVMIVGPRHQGALKHDAVEIGVEMQPDKNMHVFHAMPVTSRWLHLL